MVLFKYPPEFYWNRNPPKSNKTNQNWAMKKNPRCLGDLLGIILHTYTGIRIRIRRILIRVVYPIIYKVLYIPGGEREFWTINSIGESFPFVATRNWKPPWHRRRNCWVLQICHLHCHQRNGTQPWVFNKRAWNLPRPRCGKGGCWGDGGWPTGDFCGWKLVEIKLEMAYWSSNPTEILRRKWGELDNSLASFLIHLMVAFSLFNNHYIIIVISYLTIHVEVSPNPPKTNMTMDNPPLEDVFPIRKIGTFQCHVSFQGCFPPLDNLNAQIDLPLNQAKGTDLTPLLIAPEVLHSRPKGLRAGTKFQILMDKLDGSLPKKDETWKNFGQLQLVGSVDGCWI